MMSGLQEVYEKNQDDYLAPYFLEAIRKIAHLEADNAKLKAEITILENEVIKLEDKNDALMKLAGMYIKSYEDLVFGGAEHEEYEIGREEQDDDSNTL